MKRVITVSFSYVVLVILVITMSLQGYNKKKQYIAASGPKETTSADFWRMIWQHGATCIVMVTKCVEEGKVR